MNQSNRRIFSYQQQALQKALEVKYVGLVHRAIKKQVALFAHDVRSHGADTAAHSIRMHFLNPHIGGIIARLYKDGGLAAGRKIVAHLRLQQAKRASFGSNDGLVADILAYLNQYLLDKSVRPISETTRDWVLREIDKGIRGGLGANEIAKGLEDSEYTKFQAIRVVRTESVRGMNVGAMLAAESSPFEVSKQWIAAHDNRTRHSHRIIDGQIVDMEQPFGNGLMQPGDPNGDAASVINCRCSVGFVPKRDTNGRLIRKRPAIPVHGVRMAMTG